MLYEDGIIISTTRIYSQLYYHKNETKITFTQPSPLSTFKTGHVLKLSYISRNLLRSTTTELK